MLSVQKRESKMADSFLQAFIPS